MKDPAVSEAKMNRAIKRMVAEARDGGGGGGNDCDLSSSGGLSSSDRSSPVGMAMEVVSPRTRLPRQDEAGDVDFTVTSLGCFLDLLFEKVRGASSSFERRKVMLWLCLGIYSDLFIERLRRPIDMGVDQIAWEEGKTFFSFIFSFLMSSVVELSTPAVGEADSFCSECTSSSSCWGLHILTKVTLNQRKNSPPQMFMATATKMTIQMKDICIHINLETYKRVSFFCIAGRLWPTFLYVARLRLNGASGDWREWRKVDSLLHLYFPFFFALFSNGFVSQVRGRT